MQVGYPKLKLATLDKINCYNSKTSTVASVVNLVWSQVYHTERPSLFAARFICRNAACRTGSSTTADTCFEPVSNCAANYITL